MSSIKKMLLGMLCIAAITFVGLGSSGCNSSPKPFKQESEIYAFSGATAINLYNKVKKTTSRQTSGSVSEVTNEAQQTALAHRIYRLLPLADGFVGGKDAISVVEKTPKDAQFEKEYHTTISHLNGKSETFEVCYTETSSQEDGLLKNATVNGKILRKNDETNYALSGQKAIVENEIVVNLKIEIDANNYIKVYQTQNRAYEFNFVVFVDGQKAEETSASFDKEDGNTIIKIPDRYKGSVTTFLYKQKRNNALVEIYVCFKVDGKDEVIKIKYNSGENPTYTFSFSDGLAVEIAE